jgi:hypothetical protein
MPRTPFRGGADFVADGGQEFIPCPPRLFRPARRFGQAGLGDFRARQGLPHLGHGLQAAANGLGPFGDDAAGAGADHPELERQHNGLAQRSGARGETQAETTQSGRKSTGNATMLK